MLKKRFLHRILEMVNEQTRDTDDARVLEAGGCPLIEKFPAVQRTNEITAHMIDGVIKRSSLHAKCVVVNAEQVFVSSANFTKVGQERNIEVGLKIQSPQLAG